ncbi:MAG: efflux RND transporter periplasmic adaptor subunit, partial [Actinomycetota bacterium]|nr:efflux RND transporter periplasmic adaptor subunit [Actinomycetota bacterium]
MSSRRRVLLINGVMLLVVAGLVAYGLDTVFHKSSAQAAVRTVTASTGTVSSSVTATGNVSPAQSQSVGFATGGTITEVDVSAGQSVTAGQVLAKLDPGPAQASLTAAGDNLSAAQDNLSLANAGGETGPQQAVDANQLATASAQVSSAQATLSAAQQTAANDAANLQAAVNTAVAKVNADQAACRRGQQTACAQVGSDNTALTAATNNQATTTARDAQSVATASGPVTQAQNTLTSDQLSIAAKRYINPATMAQDNAAITSAQAAVTQAQKVLGETTLTAPFAGVVTTLTGAVGQVVSGGGSAATSASSAGSSGAAGGGAAATGAAASTSTSTSSSSSSSGILTLADMANLQVVAGFAEADASKISVNQPATVALSALPNVTVAGKVSAVSAISTVVSNVVTYNVTITLDNPPSSVRAGMTAQADVVVASRANVVSIPSAAITGTGRFSTVTVLRAGKQSIQSVVLGLQGDTTTEITSGLNP